MAETPLLPIDGPALVFGGPYGNLQATAAVLRAGERLVFEPYTKEAYEESFDWIARHQIFAGGDMGSKQYENSVITLAS